MLKAQEILGTDQDTKLLKCVEVVGSLLQERFRPLIWCRYIATSEYLANQINQQLQKKFPNLRVVSVNGTLTDEERRARILELAKFSNRVCVATDCLSEGINLQEWFDAVVHYDLPGIPIVWNSGMDGWIGSASEPKSQIDSHLWIG